MSKTINKYLVALIKLHGELQENPKCSLSQFCKKRKLNNRFSGAILKLNIIKNHGETKGSFYSWNTFFPTYQMAAIVLEEIQSIHGKRKVYKIPYETLTHNPIIREAITYYFFGLIKIKKVYKYDSL